MKYSPYLFLLSLLVGCSSYTETLESSYSAIHTYPPYSGDVRLIKTIPDYSPHGLTPSTNIHPLATYSANQTKSFSSSDTLARSSNITSSKTISLTMAKQESTFESACNNQSPLILIGKSLFSRRGTIDIQKLKLFAASKGASSVVYDECYQINSYASAPQDVYQYCIHYYAP